MQDKSVQYLERFIDKVMPRLAMGEIKVYLVLLSHADEKMKVSLRYREIAQSTGLTINGVRYAMHVLRSLKLVKREKYKPGVTHDTEYKVMQPKAIDPDLDLTALRKETRYHGVDE